MSDIPDKLLCQNPLCRKEIQYVPKTVNDSGHQNYHDIFCFHAFSPKKWTVVRRWKPDILLEEAYDYFICLVQYIYSNFKSDNLRARALGISRTAYREWYAEVEGKQPKKKFYI